jgi:hypothetical protein
MRGVSRALRDRAGVGKVREASVSGERVLLSRVVAPRSACYIEDSFPSLLYLAYKYADSFDKAVRTRAMRECIAQHGGWVPPAVGPACACVTCCMCVCRWPGPGQHQRGRRKLPPRRGAGRGHGRGPGRESHPQSPHRGPGGPPGGAGRARAAFPSASSRAWRTTRWGGAGESRIPKRLIEGLADHQVGRGGRRERAREGGRRERGRAVMSEAKRSYGGGGREGLFGAGCGRWRGRSRCVRGTRGGPRVLRLPLWAALSCASRRDALSFALVRLRPAPPLRRPEHQEGDRRVRAGAAPRPAQGGGGGARTRRAALGARVAGDAGGRETTSTAQRPVGGAASHEGLAVREERREGAEASGGEESGETLLRGAERGERRHARVGRRSVPVECWSAGVWQRTVWRELQCFFSF